MGDLKRARRLHSLRVAPHKLQELLAEAPADLEFRTRENLAVFLEDVFGSFGVLRLRSIHFSSLS